MKQWMLMLAVAGAAVVGTGCNSEAQTTGPGAPKAAPMVAEAKGDASGSEKKTPTPPDEVKEGVEAVAIDGARIALVDGEKKGEKLWQVEATIRNGGRAPLPGVEVVADLSIAGEEHAFARHSAEVRFESPLAAGEKFAWRSLFPADRKADDSSVRVSVDATRWLDPVKTDDGGWKPLDPKTAEAKTVGDPITIPVAAPSKD